jgi:hypothetical protein
VGFDRKVQGLDALQQKRSHGSRDGGVMFLPRCRPLRQGPTLTKRGHITPSSHNTLRPSHSDDIAWLCSSF